MVWQGVNPGRGPQGSGSEEAHCREFLTPAKTGINIDVHMHRALNFGVVHLHTGGANAPHPACVLAELDRGGVAELAYRGGRGNSTQGRLPNTPVRFNSGGPPPIARPS